VFRLTPRASNRDNQALAAGGLNPGCNPGLGSANGRVISNAGYNCSWLYNNRTFPRKLRLYPSLCVGQQYVIKWAGGDAVSASKDEEPSRTRITWTTGKHEVFYEKAAARQDAINRALSHNSSSMTTREAKWKRSRIDAVEGQIHWLTT